MFDTLVQWFNLDIYIGWLM